MLINVHISKRSNPEYPVALKLRQAKSERSIEETYRSPRERHTQKQFVPVAMNASLQAPSRWKSPAPKPRAKSAISERSPSTLRLNRSNVKRKPSARGRTR